ncbi:MAG: aldo/keto reductase [Suipraeoptans sp.]
MEKIDISKVPLIKLPDGKSMPAIGMGTFGNDKYESEDVSKAVYNAIEIGYRFFDGAAAYGNEVEIGKVYARALDDGLVKRNEMFILSKLWNDKHGKGMVRPALLQTLKDLQMDYLDAYLVHWPFPNYHAPGAGINDRHPDARPFFVDEFMVVWRQMEALVEEGLVRYIGVSNMTIPKLKEVLPLCNIKPVFNEVEMHPAFQQWEMFEFCKKNDIITLAYAPLGSAERPERDTESSDTVVMEMPELVKIAKQHGIHPALICLKWAVNRGHIPVPFSVRESEYTSNLKAVTEDMLSDDEMNRIKALDLEDRLIKAKVFLWQGAHNWRNIWDEDGTIDRTGWKEND